MMSSTNHFTPGIGEVVWAHEKPIEGFDVTAPATDDDFSDTELGPQWSWRFNPEMDRWSLTERRGYLRLKSCARLSGTNQESLNQLPNLLGQRLMGRKANVMTTKFDLAGVVDGQECGFHISAGENNVIGVTKLKGQLRLFFKHGNPDAPMVKRGVVISQTDLWLRAKVENGSATFFYSLDGKALTRMGPAVRLLFAGFTHNTVGFYSMHPDQQGYLDVDEFTYDYDGPKSAAPTE
ncbi:beta-xylosidase family glycoside hydrolase [Novipirellula artificiosorum]|uniref:Beta-xylosidase C-terminal Concanavalin A-like domain-containing protein n=1 Tax=Novipirellula artificiosorum TaxID=2528016 RepID=A0A5C6DQZ5_9BACT|nr:hypothetical protein [Novipirellula artificiosorum]TWU37426.1 hypothetical protein Poly41_35570 [Novipirellula artificiosorum]